MSSARALKHLHQHEQNVHAIHYSCQSLGDGNTELSPRITSIAVLHLQSSSMHSFSIHLIAEVIGVKREEICERYDQLEGEMLRSFYAFVQSHQDAIWLHWNMSNINYGFEAIAHRYKVLTQQTAPQIPDSKRFNLSSLVAGTYGEDYVDNPKMVNLMELNGGRSRDFLSGAEEVAAFEGKEYIKLHKSTMSKTYWFRNVYDKLQKRKLRTARTGIGNRINEWSEKPLSKILGFASALYALIQFVQAAYAGFPLPK